MSNYQFTKEQINKLVNLDPALISKNYNNENYYTYYYNEVANNLSLNTIGHYHHFTMSMLRRIPGFILSTIKDEDGKELFLCGTKDGNICSTSEHLPEAVYNSYVKFLEDEL